MEDNIVNEILDLYKSKNWLGIINKYHDHPNRNKVLWVFPSENNLEFLKRTLFEFNCKDILSIGCGSGLLEWIITQATSKYLVIPVSTYIHIKYQKSTKYLLYLPTVADLHFSPVGYSNFAAPTDLFNSIFHNHINYIFFFNEIVSL